jgi:hypothetical protein
MSDFPNQLAIPSVITNFDCSEPHIYAGISESSLAWPTANLALLVPLVIGKPCLVKRLVVANGGTNSGNIDMGIYRDDLTRIVSMGSTAQSAGNILQILDITDTPLAQGRYYLALAVDNTTATFYQRAVQAVILRGSGFLQMASAFPLPTTITPDSGGVANGRFPGIGMEVLRAV